ncbi:hypothetical protein SEPCBS57363_003961 [Sporothrix epigloea]|uniref:CAP-Gly domain-containing protein n=1 Tax=Sporothrix epigloea TaxID=1892477 RepID=A0ABP0DPN6_9PEZI
MSSITLPAVGDRRSYDGALCTVRYVGEVAGTTAGGLWLGVEWDDATRGKHDGVHKGVRYFSCRPRTRPPPVVLVGDAPHPALAAPPPSTPASFVRPTRPFDTPRSFLEAVRQKYASEVTEEDATEAVVQARRQIIISGKVAEEVGFDKVRRQLAQIETLRVVILDGQCVFTGDDLGDAGGTERRGSSSLSAIQTTCPSITELDLSRNQFTDMATVAAICRELPRLKGLRINGNRLTVDSFSYNGAFDGVHELAVEETLLSWEEIGRMTASFSSLTSLWAGSNELTQLLPPLPPAAMAHLDTTLTILNLEFNDFTALSDLASLSALKVLRSLHLKGCRIARISQKDQTETAQHTPSHSFSFSQSLTYIDLSYNLVTSWTFVDALPDVFPGMTSLRFAHNPIYNNPNLDSEATSPPAAATATSAASAAATTTASTEESYMIAVGRLAHLRTLNFSTISATDRTNAELFYLSRIAKQMAAVTEDSPEERAVVARHRRYAELCAIYGEPAIVRHASINPAYLEARLVQVLFALAEQSKTVSIPKSFDMYAVKAIAGRLFKMAPHKLRLVWETGEWDPVVGVDETEEEVEDDDDDDDDDGENAEKNQLEADPSAAEAEETQAGRWVKREVELKDTPRQLGFCVDGLEARIRVEVC